MVTETETPWPRAGLPVELLDPSEMAEADLLAARTVPSATLMRNAGEAVARVSLRLLETGKDDARHVVILCGPGNNGGDGYVAARVLAGAGCRVTIAAIGSRDALRGDAAEAAARWTGPIVPLADAPFESADLVVDALFGAGLSRDIDGAAKAAIERVNLWARTAGRRVLAVDIPSGVDGASGAIRGVAILASETVTFFRLKPGHVLMPGRSRCGPVALVDIGIPRDVLDSIRPQTRLNMPTLWAGRYPIPRLEGHKYGRGHALVVSGPLAQTGAARLCARGALRAGAGLVTVATPADALAIHAAALTSIMTRVADSADDLVEILADPRKNAVVLGPGLGVGASTRSFVLAVLAPSPQGTSSREPDSREISRRGIVLDADALSSFADQPHALFEAIGASGHVVVLTPHDGEFAKLFGSLVDLAAAKPQRVRAAAAVSGAIVVLKGPDTVVAHPDGRATIAASEAPWLATAGSGDVLAGMIVGLLAQMMAPFEACAAGVWLHAEAARLFGPGLISEDIPEMLPRVLSNLLASGLIERT